MESPKYTALEFMKQVIMGWMLFLSLNQRCQWRPTEEKLAITTTGIIHKYAL